MNVFLNSEIAKHYDEYYLSDQGQRIDQIEKQIISGFLEHIPMGELLDLGCGTGHWSEFFVDKGFPVTGVDISEPMLDVAKHKNLDAKFLFANAENLPFEKETFKIVASITMLEFLENQEKAVQEMYRVLKKGGYLILGCLNADSVIGKNKEKDEVFKNAHLFNLNELKLMLKDFQLLEVKTGVYLNEDYQLMDDSQYRNNIDPVFLGLFLKKI